MNRTATSILAVATLALAACPKTFYPANPPCEEDADCTVERLGSEFADYACHEFRCIPEINVPEEDAGLPDAGLPEAGPDAAVDAGPPPDAGPVDTGVIADSGPADTGPLPEHLAGGNACQDNVDNDRDGQTDCDDSDCADLLYCADEVCDNYWDDNGNDLVDCDEPSCSNHSACQARVTICDLHESGYFSGCSSCHSDQMNQQGQVTRQADGDYRVDHTSPETLYASLNVRGSQRRTPIVPGNADESLVFAKLNGSQAQLSPACANDDQECLTNRGVRMPRGGVPLSAQALREVEQWINGNDVQRCLEGFPVEDCQDEVDNDGDGRIDCQDRDCASHLLCTEPTTICQIQEAGVFLPCVQCHVTENRGGFRLNTASPRGLYDSLVGVSSQSEIPLVVPGDSLSSYLYLKLSGQQLTIQGGSGDQMPLSSDPISQQHQDMLRSWIDRSEQLDTCLGN